jgi:hypothetical protein
MTLDELASIDIEKKIGAEKPSYSPSVSDEQVTGRWLSIKADLKETFPTKVGWVGDYVCASCLASFTGLH